MDDLKKYQCLLCEDYFFANPDDIDNLDYPKCAKCRSKENGSFLNACKNSADSISELAKKAVRIISKSHQGYNDDTLRLASSEDETPPLNMIDRIVDCERTEIDFSKGTKKPNDAKAELLNTILNYVEHSKQAPPTDDLNYTDNYPLKWECIGNLFEAYLSGKLSNYSHYVGLYMHTINGEVKYIGRAIEYNNGGFRKRLSDYCRDSNSARKHKSGQVIFENKDIITTYLLVVGSDESAANRTITLEKEYIRKYNPPWNVQYNK